MARNPLDVVVARVAAKWQRGAPQWPECTTRTIGECADALCGSMERMVIISLHRRTSCNTMRRDAMRCDEMRRDATRCDEMRCVEMRRDATRCSEIEGDAMLRKDLE